MKNMTNYNLVSYPRNVTFTYVKVSFLDKVVSGHISHLNFTILYKKNFFN